MAKNIFFADWGPAKANRGDTETRRLKTEIGRAMDVKGRRRAELRLDIEDGDTPSLPCGISSRHFNVCMLRENTGAVAKENETVSF